MNLSVLTVRRATCMSVVLMTIKNPHHGSFDSPSEIYSRGWRSSCKYCVMMEGAEESASTDLEKYLENTEMTCFSQTYWFGNKEIEIAKVSWKSQGQQGLLPLICRSRSADVDIHSKFGAVIESASWYLLNAISSMRWPGTYPLSTASMKDCPTNEQRWILLKLMPLKMQIDSS